MLLILGPYLSMRIARMELETREGYRLTPLLLILVSNKETGDLG
jgi:hypothetical protein